MKRTTKRKLKTRPIVALFLIIIFGIMAYCVIDMKSSLKSNQTAKAVKISNEIEEYGYKLYESDSKYYKEQFKKLKTLLEKEDFEEQEYAELVSKLFLIDFFSLKNAINKNDVGGKQYVYKEYQETFEKYAKDTVYKYVENNIYNNRKQELPSVTKVEVTDIKKDTYSSKSGFTDDNAYYVNLKITYDQDLNYQTVSTLTLAHSKDKLEIVSME